MNVRRGALPIGHTVNSRKISFGDSLQDQAHLVWVAARESEAYEAAGSPRFDVQSVPQPRLGLNLAMHHGEPGNIGAIENARHNPLADGATRLPPPSLERERARRAGLVAAAGQGLLIDDKPNPNFTLLPLGDIRHSQAAHGRSQKERTQAELPARNAGGMRKG
jgi:hypothetical protein